MFCIVLKELRISHFLTQKEFCRRSNIPLGTYKNWELGRQLPDPKSWEKLLIFVKNWNDTSYVKLERTYLSEKVGLKK